MPVQVFVSINFEAQDAAAAQAAIDGLSGLPEGAMVNSGFSEQLVAGIVTAQGAIEAPPLLAAPEEES